MIAHKLLSKVILQFQFIPLDTSTSKELIFIKKLHEKNQKSKPMNVLCKTIDNRIEIKIYLRDILRIVGKFTHIFVHQLIFHGIYYIQLSQCELGLIVR
jgi:hypothetical protein